MANTARQPIPEEHRREADAIAREEREERDAQWALDGWGPPRGGHGDSYADEVRWVYWLETSGGCY